MRTDTAARQASAMEALVAKTAAVLGFNQDGGQHHVIASLGNALLEAYALGAVEALEVAPWEVTEVAYRHRAAPADMMPMTRQGWEPYMVSETSVPKHVAATLSKNSEMVPGFLVRYKRRMQPQAQPDNDRA